MRNKSRPTTFILVVKADGVGQPGGAHLRGGARRQAVADHESRDGTAS
jgi:hypothetical protein